jgi:hypothetical protein
MTEEVQKKPFITVDGAEYTIADLDPAVQQRVGLYQKWSAQATELQAEFTKAQYAANAIGKEIAEMIKGPKAEEAAPAPKSKKK